MSHARLAVSTLFFVNGAVLASWLPHIPAVKARLTSGDGQLGLVLLAMAGGAAVALPAAGWLIGRLGSRVLSSVAVVALCVAMPLPVFSPTLPALVVALAALGACHGLLDVSMNAQAAVVEQRGGRRSCRSSTRSSAWGAWPARSSRPEPCRWVSATVPTSVRPRWWRRWRSPWRYPGWCPRSPNPTRRLGAWRVHRGRCWRWACWRCSACWPRARWRTGARSICTTRWAPAPPSPLSGSPRSRWPWLPGAWGATG